MHGQYSRRFAAGIARRWWIRRLVQTTS
jgi:hypothetical protein